jgi:hypothetical protein
MGLPFSEWAGVNISRIALAGMRIESSHLFEKTDDLGYSRRLPRPPSLFPHPSAAKKHSIVVESLQQSCPEFSSNE